ncbi:MAG: biotin--[acetyl-CoA-carboxylase] ligase [Acidobacteriia bacterium]|nr:biotin--[acetyl-CoA-carboxylase] ligase [Terriglobia bacterium]
MQLCWLKTDDGRLPSYNSRIKRTTKKRPARTGAPASLPGIAQKTDVRLGRIVRLLMDNATVVASGTKIAEEIGTSRSEVWRLVQQLRSLGVEIVGHPATGYRLQSAPDLLLPEILAPFVKGTIFGKNIHHYYKIGSTSAAAMEAAAAGAPEGTVFLAEQQTAGRGRGAHSWHSPQSTGIYCSVVLRPALPPSEALVLSLAAGLAVHAAVQEIDSRVQPDLKWPNDPLLDGKKFCGLLTEMNAEATRVRYIVLGIGLNVNQTSFPAELQPLATSLRLATGTEWSRMELCASLLKSLDREYRSLVESAGAHDSILRRFQERSSWIRGRQVRIEENGGGFDGVTEGLDPRGFLQVRTAQGLRTVLSGTVTAR